MIEFVKDLLRRQQSHLSHFYNNLDAAKADEMVNFCAATPGLLVLTGIGKSGLVAEKIAMTLVSTGTKALYLPTTNFLHGDIGILSKDDTVIMLSKSGETHELLHLIPFIQKRGSRVAAWVSNPQSRLALHADCTITLPVEQELCPFDLAPTISAEVQLLFGDALAISLMKRKGFSLTDYSENHPAGTIGKKATLTVQDIMLPLDKLPLCHPSKTLQEVLPEFSEKRLGCLIVANEQREIQGIFTDGDLRRALQSQGSSVLEKTLSALMTPAALTTRPREMAWDAMKLMQKDPSRWVMMLPVVDGRHVVGLIRMHDIIHAGIS